MMKAFTEEERKFVRKSIYTFVDCFGEDGCAARIRVRNISESGLGGQIEGEWSPCKGQRIWLEFRDMAPMEGTVARVANGYVGVEFDQLVRPDKLLPGSLVRKSAGLP